MTEKQWRECLGELVRDYMRSPEMDFYFSIKMNKPRAAVMVKQQSLFVRHRRECWAHVSANCPVMAVKQRILEHEYEEIIRDEYSDYGHLHLIIRQGKSVGLEPDEIGAEVGQSGRGRDPPHPAPGDIAVERRRIASAVGLGDGGKIDFRHGAPLARRSS